MNQLIFLCALIATNSAFAKDSTSTVSICGAMAPSENVRIYNMNASEYNELMRDIQDQASAGRTTVAQCRLGNNAGILAVVSSPTNGNASSAYLITLR